MEAKTIIVIGVAVMLVLSLCIILFVSLYQRRVIAHHMELKKINEQKQQELVLASIQSEENERARIASELHDDVGASLASARLFLYKKDNSQYDEKVITQSKKLLDESINKIRSISHKLQPATLQHLGLEQSLASLIETLNNSGTITASYVASRPLPRTDDHVELAAYRISQELLANIIKHSQTTRINAATDATDDEIDIVFTHNGHGLTQEMYEALIYKKGATGLKNIVNRLKSIHGTLLFYKTEAELYQTKLTIPLTTQIKS